MRLRSSVLPSLRTFRRDCCRRDGSGSLALAPPVAAPRPIWLLDEPSVSLDATSIRVLDKAIAGHLAQGGIAVVASHTPLKVKFAERAQAETVQ